jgi:hypothetical protein
MWLWLWLQQAVAASNITPAVHLRVLKESCWYSPISEGELKHSPVIIKNPVP